MKFKTLSHSPRFSVFNLAFYVFHFQTWFYIIEFHYNLANARGNNWFLIPTLQLTLDYKDGVVIKKGGIVPSVHPTDQQPDRYADLHFPNFMLVFRFLKIEISFMSLYKKTPDTFFDPSTDIRSEN